LAVLIWQGAQGGLGPNPVETITRFTGDWTLQILLITLAVTPVRTLTGWAWLIRLRRMLGLFAFFYAALHLTTYLWLDQFFDWTAILEDIVKRPYITVGFAAFVLMLPLAVTSTQGWMRRLGKDWKRLHRAVYIIGILGVLHALWLAKADLFEPAVDAVILAVLLGARVAWLRVGRRIRSGIRGALPAGVAGSSGARGDAGDAQHRR
jgi:sulfoxide reductase heme-binding subunit YedZ